MVVIQKALLIGLVIGSSATTVGAAELQPIIDACGPGYTAPLVLGMLKKDGWRPITNEEFEAFAPMLADSYMHAPYDGLYPPLKPSDNREALIEKFMAFQSEYQNSNSGQVILIGSDSVESFILVSGAASGEGVASPPACVFYSVAGGYSEDELSMLLGDSPKHETPLGYRQVALARNAEGAGSRYKLEAKVADEQSGGTVTGSHPRTRLILTIIAFKKN